jgi:hypothetical protein
MNPAGSTKSTKGKITERSLMVGYHNGWTYMNENGVNNLFSLAVASDGGVQVLKPQEHVVVRPIPQNENCVLILQINYTIQIDKNNI